MSAAFCFSNRTNAIEYYHNSSWLEHGGAPDAAAKTAFVYAIDAYIKKTNKYQKNESKITFSDIADCLILVTNCFSTRTSYENQTKKSITNRFIREAMTDFFKEKLEIYFIENKAEADRIADQVLINKRSREQAEKARVSIKKNLTKNLDLANRVQKFVDCRSRDADKREILYRRGRFRSRQCQALARRGIPGHHASARQDLELPQGRLCPHLQKRDHHRSSSRCSAAAWRSKSTARSFNNFSLENLRWNKVVICTDADVDGYQIRTLILTMLWRLVPTLIREGYVYIAESPLYEIQAKGKTWFAYSDREKAEIVESIGNAKIVINRSKGLGENDPEMMWLTTMNPDTRRLIRVMPEDADETARVFDLLLGDNLAGRKEHIAEVGSRYLDLADLS